MAVLLPCFQKHRLKIFVRGSTSILCAIALLRNCSFVDLSPQRPAALIFHSSRAAIDCKRLDCEAAAAAAAAEADPEEPEEPGVLKWSVAKKCQARWKSICPCCIDSTTLETMQPQLEAFAEHLKIGYSDMSPAVRKRKEKEAEEALAAISSGVLRKAREASIKILGDGVWDAAVAAIATYNGGDHIHAHLVLANAYGWKAWIEMNQPVYLDPKPLPPVEQFHNSLRWLREGPLAMTEEELKSALVARPLPYLTNPAKKYKSARSCAPEQWRDPKIFRELVRREPKVLALTWNCCYTDPLERDRVLGVLSSGESLHCDGECTKCWRAVTPGLMNLALDGIGV
eukprot:CAMPEP_0172781882 /NCGR_PEP_ID=MMETSP1074-20121228/203652_1 /TAXON_ID=2916 /ORGANISM="Ceratium fusus, Strain PA161109" /LENGTH=341 /DNA_ID=CAMNT_0013618861 /DNA_START=59 /DNA_END=1084 /DNA_ORIENTATION=+